jgi:hypothetical protein
VQVCSRRFLQVGVSIAATTELFGKTQMTKAMRLRLSGGEGEPRSSGRGFVRTALLCLCLLFAVGMPAQQQGKPTFTTFEAAGAGTGTFQGTVGISINTAGAIAGMYVDASNVYHGFVRAANGTIADFEAPGRRHGHVSGNPRPQHQSSGGYHGNVL